MKIKVVGTGCDKCDRLYENTCEAVKLLGLNESVEKVEDLMEIVRMGILQTPVLAADGEILIRDRIAKPREIAELLRKKL